MYILIHMFTWVLAVWLTYICTYVLVDMYTYVYRTDICTFGCVLCYMHVP